MWLHEGDGVADERPATEVARGELEGLGLGFAGGAEAEEDNEGYDQCGDYQEKLHCHS